MTQEYLFICGCPRSGTTALVRLLNAHRFVAIGMERYKFYANKKNIERLNNSCFTSNIFFDLKDNQTNIHWKYFYDQLRDKYQIPIKYLGDKYPHYYRYYHQINNSLVNVKWIFMVRDVVSIAKSYNARASDPNDSWSKTADYKKAVEHWNESLEETWKYQKSNPQANLFICEYEKLFNYNIGYLNSILDFLEIKLEYDLKRYFDSMRDDWNSKQHSVNQNAGLEQAQMDYIQEHANFSLRDNLLKKFELPTRVATF